MKLTDFAPYTLLQDIASRIYASAGSKSEKFSIMCAFHIIGSASQLAWRTGLGKGTVTSCYQMFTAHSAFGKDFYRTAVLEYLEKVDPAIIGKKPGSVQGFVSELISWNTLSFVIDEYNIWLTSTLKNPGTKDIQEHLLTLYSGQKELSGVQLKTNRTPQVIRPRVSVAGFCTIKGFNDLLTNKSIVSDGLLSRCLIWQEEFIDESNYSSPKDLEPSPFEIEWLKQIYMPGGDQLQKTKDKNFQDYLDADRKRAPYKHESVYHLESKIPVNKEAAAYIDDVRGIGASKFNLEAEDARHKDTDSTGLIGRHVYMVERLAAILALSKDPKKEPVITLDDVQLADRIMHEHNIELITDILANRTNNDHEKKRLKVINFFKSKRDEYITMDMLSDPFRDCTKSFKHSMLISLYEDGIISIYQKGNPINPDDLKYDKIPHGSIYLLK